MKIFIAIVFILFFVRLYVCRKKRNINANLTEKEKEKKCIELLQNILRQESIYFYVKFKKQNYFNFWVENSLRGPIFILCLDKRSESINVREEIKNIVFFDDGSVYGKRKIIDHVRHLMLNLIDIGVKN